MNETNLTRFWIALCLLIGAVGGYYIGYEQGQDDLIYDCEVMWFRGMWDCSSNHHGNSYSPMEWTPKTDIYNRSYYAGYLEMQIYYENETNPDSTTVCIEVNRNTDIQLITM